MHLYPAGRCVRIWEPGESCARGVGATKAARLVGNRRGSQRAAENPLGARE